MHETRSCSPPVPTRGRKSASGARRDRWCREGGHACGGRSSGLIPIFVVPSPILPGVGRDHQAAHFAVIPLGDVSGTPTNFINIYRSRVRFSSQVSPLGIPSAKFSCRGGNGHFSHLPSDRIFTRIPLVKKPTGGNSRVLGPQLFQQSGRYQRIQRRLCFRVHGQLCDSLSQGFHLVASLSDLVYSVRTTYPPVKHYLLGQIIIFMPVILISYAEWKTGCGNAGGAR